MLSTFVGGHRFGLATLSLVTACGIASASGCVLVKGGKATVSPDASAAKAEGKKGKPVNPGGMWMPEQLPAQAELMAAMGYDGDVTTLADPTKFPLNAVVSLGGCTASFVSAEGLVVTNHHCAVGMLGHNSTAEKNLMQTGYLAANRGAELPAGPGRQLYVTTAQEDVTAQITAAAATATTDVDKVKAMRDKIDALNASCTDFAAGKRCYVADFFEGSRFYLIRQDVIRDLRVVYAPAEGIGRFGGEVDNWQWPRHTGDYTFLRAYVAPDGKSAEYSPNNVPYKPKSFLKVASQDLNPGDFVMVAGYPGRTARLKTAQQVDHAVRKTLPERVAWFERQIAVLDGLAKSDPALGIKVAGKMRGYNNYLTNTRGQIDGLGKNGLARSKFAQEAKMRAFIAEDPARFAAYGRVIDEMSSAQQELNTINEQFSGDEVLSKYMSSYLAMAGLMLSTAKQREEGKLTPSKAKKAENRLAGLIATSDPRIEKAVIKAAFTHAATSPNSSYFVAYPEVVGTSTDVKTIEKQVDRFVDRSRFKDEAYVKSLLATATVKQLEKNSDPYLKLATKLKAQQESEAGKRKKALEAKLKILRPQYIAVLRQFQNNKPLAPDANSTLRVTFGTIRGYQPAADKPTFEPFTTVDEMVKKHTGTHPFNAPSNILAAAARKDMGPYLDKELNTLPVNFLTDLDITGGNSGSATLNAKGELIGLVFDMNFQGIASDWVFRSDVTRAIHVDMRYVLWVMDAVDQADHLLKEMGVEPKIGAAVAQN